MHNSKPLSDWQVGTITGQCHNKYSGHVAFTFAIDCGIVELI